jgi:hypothetical protein
LEEQEQIGWDLGMRGYVSQSWGLAIAAHLWLAPKNGKGKVWTWRAILELWDFAYEMWEHCNAVLHNAELKAFRKIWDDDINDEINKLYDNVESFAAEDRWYFEMPLVLWLKNPSILNDDGLSMHKCLQPSCINISLSARCCWLLTTHIWRELVWWWTGCWDPALLQSPTLCKLL